MDDLLIMQRVLQNASSPFKDEKTKVRRYLRLFILCKEFIMFSLLDHFCGYSYASTDLPNREDERKEAGFSIYNTDERTQTR